MSIIAFQVTPRRQYYRQANTREADPKYLAFIRQQPCTIKGCKSRFQEAAHTGDRALGRKANDRNTIPLCLFHHQTGNQSYHRLGRRNFETVHKLDIAALILELNAWYEAERLAG
jgi:hypothetical protein